MMRYHEYDRFEIPEEYKKMSREELREEAERELLKWRAEHPRKENGVTKWELVEKLTSM